MDDKDLEQSPRSCLLTPKEYAITMLTPKKASRYDNRKQRRNTKKVTSNGPLKQLSKSKFCLSRESIVKNRINICVNTDMTGPLKCNKDCVTMVRHREQVCVCDKNSLKKLFAKEVQTIAEKACFNTDKACAPSIESASFGVQFKKSTNDIKIGLSAINNSLHNTLQSFRSNGNEIKRNYLKPNHTSYKPIFSNLGYTEALPENHLKPSAGSISENMRNYLKPNHTSYKPKFRNLVFNEALPENYLKPSTGSISARRWALSYYPIRGPDF